MGLQSVLCILSKLANRPSPAANAIRLARRLDAPVLGQRGYGNIGVAFTYNEPLLSYEYIMDTAPLLRAQDLAMIMVSNGYIEEEPLRTLLPYIDA